MKIIVWYHCVLSGERIKNQDHAVTVMQSQMSALHDSSLEMQADEIHVGVNGGDGDALLVSAFAPKRSILHVHGIQAQTELSTLGALQKSLAPGDRILYHHIKGVQYPNNPVWDNWRRCMERACIWNWLECLDWLDRCDTVGAHWMSNPRYPIIPMSQRYWGGNFWWAKSDYLLTLPPLPPDQYEKRYEAEVWIGKSKHKPVVHDFAPHFPMSCPA